MITQHQREQNNQAIDDQIKAIEERNKALQEESKKKQEDVDEEWSDSRIAKVVSEALANGFFQDVNGQFVDLKKTYIEWMDEFNNGTSIAGQQIKDEFIKNLEEVKAIMVDIKGISSDIGFNYVNPEIINKQTVLATGSIPNITSSNLFSAENLLKGLNSNKTVKIDNLLNIEGNVDDSMMDKLDAIVDMTLSKFTSKISDLGFQMG